MAFNDLVNDILDRLEISASVKSELVITRKGRKRCMEYMPSWRGTEWEKDSGQFEDCCRYSPVKSIYPDGTPGIDSYERNAA